jgi:23S rRNA (cytidine1920-2'-O)/16S rRNA (cytidine1409-2'-O)-methyltransferase
MTHVGCQRLRIDRWLVDNGHFGSREKAQHAIEAGRICVNGRTIQRASTAVPEDACVTIAPADRDYVSRGGMKLEQAIREFNIQVKGLRALDVGASTGGFTDCLLQHGVRSVVAVDVGTGQLDATMRSDPRVVSLEQTDIRQLDPARVTAPFDLIVVDCSFISLAMVLPAALRFAAPGTQFVVLVKPQFEAGRQGVDRSGVVRNPRVRARTIDDARWQFTSRGLVVLNGTDCHTHGPAGNVEYLMHAMQPPSLEG